MKIKDYYDIEMISNDDPTNLTDKADVRISFKDFANALQNPRVLEKFLLNILLKMD